MQDSGTLLEHEEADTQEQGYQSGLHKVPEVVLEETDVSKSKADEHASTSEVSSFLGLKPLSNIITRYLLISVLRVLFVYTCKILYDLWRELLWFIIIWPNTVSARWGYLLHMLFSVYHLSPFNYYVSWLLAAPWFFEYCVMLVPFVLRDIRFATPLWCTLGFALSAILLEWQILDCPHPSH